MPAVSTLLTRGVSFQKEERKEGGKNVPLSILRKLILVYYALGTVLFYGGVKKGGREEGGKIEQPAPIRREIFFPLMDL